MLRPVRGRRRRLLLIVAALGCVLITILNYSVLSELPTDSRYFSGYRFQDDCQSPDIERRLQQLERKLYINDTIEKFSLKSHNSFTQRLERLEKLIGETEDPVPKKCEVPNDWLFPFCRDKVEWMEELWGSNKPCYIDKHKVQPQNRCSILIYLSEVEMFCPVLPWRKKSTQRKEKELASLRYELDSAFIDKLNKENLRWMRHRITTMWPDWVAAAREFAAAGSLRRPHRVKQVFIFLGTYSYQPNWLDLAFDGAPLGEMVQWSDLIASLYILGHNLTIAANRTTYKNFLSVPKDSNCAGLVTPEFDIIYTDYNGMAFLSMDITPNLSPYRCRLRILDSFGTQAEFNYGAYQGVIPGGKSPWAGTDLNLRQLFTMFPHSPDNSFLGFVVSSPVPTDVKPLEKKPIGLVYGKDVEFWQGKRAYLDTLHKYLEIHGTFFSMTQEEIEKNVPSYVIKHGILKKPDLEELLKQTKVFIGLGFPYEGPAPLEAIAQGCIFLNAKFDSPHSRLNTDFFKMKPTLRELTSQHPYAEVFIGKPHVFTINITDLPLVEETIKEILKTEVKPYLPFEWTPKGMLERVNAFTEYYDFCEHGERWPPLSELKLAVGGAGKSCVDVCNLSGLLCEPSFFVDINSESDLKRAGLECKSVNLQESLLAPFYNSTLGSCTLQTQLILFSCVAKSATAARLCPCRDYQAQQVAFCKQCH